jgi:ubiquinone/menaquinone biosynthesis C-methylase UbiE
MVKRSLREVLKGFFGRGVCPCEGAAALLNPLRRLFLSPEQLVSRLELIADNRVLEIGPGPGYFAPAVVRALHHGTWVGLDLQYRMLTALRHRLPSDSDCTRIVTQGDATMLPFAQGSFDVVFLVAVLGEVPDAPRCVAACVQVLKPGGLLSITEQPGDPDALSREAIIALTREAGCELAAAYGRGKSFTLNFRVPSL